MWTRFRRNRISLSPLLPDLTPINRPLPLYLLIHISDPKTCWASYSFKLLFHVLLKLRTRNSVNGLHCLQKHCAIWRCNTSGFTSERLGSVRVLRATNSKRATFKTPTGRRGGIEIYMAPSLLSDAFTRPPRYLPSWAVSVKESRDITTAAGSATTVARLGNITQIWRYIQRNIVWWSTSWAAEPALNAPVSRNGERWPHYHIQSQLFSGRIFRSYRLISIRFQGDRRGGGYFDSFVTR